MSKNRGALQAYNFSVEIGKYVGRLHRDFNQGVPTTPLCQYTLNDQLFRHKDFRAADYYKASFNGPATDGANACLSWLLAALNFSRHVLDPMAVDRPSTLVKLKFVTLYHVVLSLKNLRATYWPQQVLTDRSKAFINSILKNKELEQITKPYQFRNILVHYALEDVPLAQLDLNLELYGLVEHFFQGRSMGDLDHLLDQQIERIATALEDWLAYEEQP